MKKIPPPPKKIVQRQIQSSLDIFVCCCKFLSYQTKVAISNSTNLEECSKQSNNTCSNSKNAGKYQRKLLTFSNELLFERRAKKNGRGRERES